MSSNIVHLRTCYDSCRALAELINYVASDGDLSIDADLRQDLETKLKVRQKVNVAVPVKYSVPSFPHLKM